MKSLLSIPVLLACDLTVKAALYSFSYNSGFANNANVPDGNLNDWSDTRAVNGIADGPLLDVSVRLNVSGGFNGDLYGYLSYNGALVPLLNRVGVGTGSSFGYTDAGLNVRFTDSANHNIHFYQTVSGYSVAGGAAWQPDGRTVNPVNSPPPAFDANGTVTFASYYGMNPNGNWTLFLADVSAGGGSSQVLSWGLDISTVPEPVGLAMAWFGIAVAGGECLRRLRLSRQLLEFIRRQRG